MGYQLTHIKELLFGKASTASLFVTPLVVGGIALIGYQTYSMLTGKSFKEINYEIGQLWAARDAAPNTQPNKAPSVVFKYRPVKKSPVQFQPEKLRVRPARNINRRERSVQIAPSASQIRITENIANLERLSTLSIAPVVSSAVLAKYFDRLDNTYLIDPNMNPQTGKWYVSYSFSPTLNYRSFGYDASNMTGVRVVGNYRYVYGLTESARNATDRSVTGYSVGVDIGKRLLPRLSISTGLHYSQYGEQVQICEANHRDPNFREARFMGQEPMYSSYSTEDVEGNFPYTNSYSYFEVPLLLNYDALVFDRSKITVNAGLHYQRLDHVNALVYDFETDYYYWFTHKKDIFRTHGWGMSTGVTISQFVGERVELFINPQFKTNLNSTFKSPYPVQQRQYSTGLRLGVKHELF